MDTLQPQPDPAAGLQRLIDERALTILADLRPGASNGVTPGTFPGLLQSLEDRFPGLRVIGVCGDNGNAAGARVAEGLALSAAKTGRRTLVIDTDARSPRQHILWNGPGSPIGPGLRDTLVAGLPVSPDAIHPTRLSNCRLIPMGYPCDHSDPELFAHVHLEKLLGVHAPAMADTVVVAMPSLDMVAMCAAVGIHMDAVLVALGSRVASDVVGANLDRLLESGTRVAGVVVVPAGEESASAGSGATLETVVPIFPPPNPFAEGGAQPLRAQSAAANADEKPSEGAVVSAGI
ncbi:MAG: tyrosine-protein kinase family protein, partial [Armatimonadaceae bacterium]